MQKSLLNFFSKTPKREKDNPGAPSSSSVQSPVIPKNTSEDPKPHFNVADELGENSPPPPSSQHKRRRVVLDSSDEEDNKSREKSPVRKGNVPPSPLADRLSNFNRQFGRDLTIDSPKATASPARKSIPASPTLKKVLLTGPDQFNSSITDSSFAGGGGTIDAEDEEADGTWSHLTYQFLQPDRIKDASGRRPSHPDYDPRTLFVPEDFLRKQSPGMRQWWALKSQNFDTLLFFKMGKFYELYHMDAVIAVEELRLSYMRGAHAHSGFPEIAFQRMADRLLHRGYKVARIEQTETPEGMAKRAAGRSGVDKVVRREICQVITPGTWFAPLRNGINGDAAANSAVDASQTSQAFSSSQPEISADLSHNRHLLVVLEDRGHDKSQTTFGVALLKASTGEILIGQFVDDIHYSRLCTVIAHFPPSQIVFERGNLNTKLMRILKARLPDVPFEGLLGGKQFLDARETICTLESSAYFSLGKSDDTLGVGDASKDRSWPSDLLMMLDPNDPLRRTPLPHYELALRCLGAVVFYLRYCLADTEILSLGLIREYRPVDGGSTCTAGAAPSNGSYAREPFYDRQVNMVLDSVTLENLEILASSFNGSTEGTLLERLDTCCTPFGRRLMRSWLVNPPCHPETITRRQDAIEELMELSPQLHSIREALRRLPDLERLLTKIHIMGWNATKPDHPESRAILVDELVYSKKKIIDFLLTLGGFKSAIKIIRDFSKIGPKTEYLHSITTLRTEDGAYPDYADQLAMFDNAFNHEEAKREGRIVVEPGFDPEFDKACAHLKEAEEAMEDFLQEQARRIGCQLSYIGTGKNRFQIEVPDSFLSRVPSRWEATGQRKGARRFRPPAINELFERLLAAEDVKQESIQGIMRRLFASFSSNFMDWQAAVRCLGELDCLFSLANYSASAAAVTCRPLFYPLSPGAKPFLEIENGFHPCLTRVFSGADITPNDVQLGLVPGQEDEGGRGSGTTTRSGFKPGVTTLLITGPNMGGKSTLMRQTALLSILAHLGCHIPANSCRLTPVDRIFTRIGASDRLISGQSTFYVELAETAVILRHATPHSLVLIDELGRGTSTRDGASLAGAVLKRLALVGPLTLFSTHYHSLAASICASSESVNAAIDVGHMDCLVGDDDEEGEGAFGEHGSKKEEEEEKKDREVGIGGGAEKITFLYKLVPAACPKSYGFNVAHLAHIPEELINNGVAMAKEFEKATLVFACLRDVLSGTMSREEATAWRSRLSELTREKIYGTKKVSA